MSTSGGRSFAALRNKDCRPYLFGAALAMMADNIEHVITYWVLWREFHSPALSGFQVLSHWLPFLLFSATAGQIADWLEAQDDSVDLGAVARTLAARNHGRSRGAVVGHTRDELVAGLRALAAGDPGPGVFSADAPAGTGDVWVFSGFGSQHRKMAKELYLSNPLFASCLDAVDELIDFEAGYRIAESMSSSMVVIS